MAFLSFYQGFLISFCSSQLSISSDFTLFLGLRGYYPRGPLYHHSIAAQPERNEAERVRWPLYYRSTAAQPERSEAERVRWPLYHDPSGAKRSESDGRSTPAQPERSEAHSLDSGLSHSNDCLPLRPSFLLLNALPVHCYHRLSMEVLVFKHIRCDPI